MEPRARTGVFPSMNQARPFLYVALTLIGFLGCTESVGPADANGRTVLGANSTGGGGGGTTAQRVSVGDNFFAPATITVAVKDTVTWVWSGNNPHSVTFSDGHDSGVKTTG